MVRPDENLAAPSDFLGKRIPVENVWQFMRDNWLSNRVSKGYDDIVAHCCLVDQPWRIRSIGSQDWAERF